MAPLHAEVVAANKKQGQVEEEGVKSDVSSKIDQVEVEADWKDALLDTLLKMSRTAFDAGRGADVAAVCTGVNLSARP